MKLTLTEQEWRWLNGLDDPPEPDDDELTEEEAAGYARRLAEAFGGPVTALEAAECDSDLRERYNRTLAELVAAFDSAGDCDCGAPDLDRCVCGRRPTA
jgi:hypothetical protein